MKTVWYQLTTLLTDRRGKIESVEPLAKKYHQELQKLAQVMSNAEATLDEQKFIGTEPGKVHDELEKVKVRLVCKKSITSRQLQEIEEETISGITFCKLTISVIRQDETGHGSFSNLFQRHYQT